MRRSVDMANPEHVEVVHTGAEVIREWREGTAASDSGTTGRPPGAIFIGAHLHP